MLIHLSEIKFYLFFLLFSTEYLSNTSYNLDGLCFLKTLDFILS